MRSIFLLAFVAFSSGAKLNRNYLPPSFAQSSSGSDSFLETPRFGPGSLNQGKQYSNGNSQSINYYNGATANGYASQIAERSQAAFERNAAILRLDNENDGEKYAFAYETENGIYAEENGVATNGVNAQGGFSYVGDDGKQYSIRYTADENGFQPQGEHLPTPPPIPEEILKALEQNARDEAAGIYDDGSYNEKSYNGNGYDSSSGYSYSGTGNNLINAALQRRAQTIDNLEKSRKSFDSPRTRTYLPPRDY